MGLTSTLVANSKSVLYLYALAIACALVMCETSIHAVSQSQDGFVKRTWGMIRTVAKTTLGNVPSWVFSWIPSWVSTGSEPHRPKISFLEPLLIRPVFTISVFFLWLLLMGFCLMHKRRNMAFAILFCLFCASVAYGSGLVDPKYGLLLFMLAPFSAIVAGTFCNLEGLKLPGSSGGHDPTVDFDEGLESETESEYEDEDCDEDEEIEEIEDEEDEEDKEEACIDLQQQQHQAQQHQQGRVLRSAAPSSPPSYKEITSS